MFAYFIIIRLLNRIFKILQMSSPNTLCNLMIEEADLKKLEDLDPFQTEGYQSNARVSVLVKIFYTDESGKITVDAQVLNFQILTRWVRSIQKHKQQPSLQSLRIIITSDQDIFLAFTCNCSSSTFDSIKTKNQLNLHFSDFPNTLIKLLRGTGGNSTEKNQVQLRLTHQGTGKLQIFQETDYKRLQLIELLFQSCNIEKAHQSIIYRYNFNRTKLSMIENSIQTVYKILAEKNPALLHYIQKSVGVEE